MTRQAPYPDKEIRLSESGEKIDRILKRIIASDKTLEVNTNHGLNPNAEILARYFELGGRNVSFGSDAHHGGLCDGWDEAVKVLKDIGFPSFPYLSAESAKACRFERLPKKAFFLC